MEWNNTVEACIHSKDFKDLTEEERQQVLSCLSKDAYEDYRALAKAGKSLGDAPVPPAVIQENLQQAFRKRYRRRNLPLSGIATPLWQAAAVAAMFLLLGKVIDWAPVHASPSLAVQMRDSVWLERLSRVVNDTAVAMLDTFDKKQQELDSDRLVLQEFEIHDSMQEDHMLNSPFSAAVDTPDWARRSACIDRTYLNHLYRLH